MRIRCYLIVSRAGNLRVTKGRPTAKPTELAIELNLEVPNSFFVRPVPVLNVTIPPLAEPDPEAVVKITAEAVAEALRLEVGQVHDGLVEMMEERES